MPDINLSQIQQQLVQEAAKLYYAVDYTPDDVLSVALTGVNLNDVNIIVVNTIEDLPNLQYGNPNVPNGMVYFVQSLGIIVISSNSTWLTLDGVTVRTDAAFGVTWAWGVGSVGRLGDNTIVSKSSPVSVVGGFTDWCQVSAGIAFSLGVRTNGTAWAWGYNSQGQLGDNTTVSRSSPVSVVGGFLDWCQVSASRGVSANSLGVRQNGTAWAWGSGSVGILGDNTIVSKSSPVSVIGGFTDWCQVSAGDLYSLAVRQNGTAWAWGFNNLGQLGDNTVVDKSSPVSVVGGFTDWCQISAGNSHSLAVRQNGTAWAWGSANDGALGDNTIVSKSSPVSVIGGFTNWCQVSAGIAFSLGVRTNGTAWAWGFNGQGRLGDNSATAKSSPVSVVGGFTDWCQVSTGASFSLALRQNGTAWAWGYANSGRLGDNSIVDKSSPVSVAGGFCDWCQVSAGSAHSLGIISS
jgi:alpha-tubulin suppressor-like RCC1 family protein